jgi:hypothetical protein
VKFDIAAIGDGSVLSGSSSGRQLFATLVAALPDDPEKPEPIYLDFAGVAVATGSYLREGVIEFRNFARGRKTNFYPIIANANSDILDEILEVVMPRSDVIMACKLDDGGQVLWSRYIGKLDPLQRLTYDLVKEYRETTAVQLMERHDDGKRTTAWNNRLAALSSSGLISEEALGRTKIYRAFEGSWFDGRGL